MFLNYAIMISFFGKIEFQGSTVVHLSLKSNSMTNRPTTIDKSQKNRPNWQGFNSSQVSLLPSKTKEMPCKKRAHFKIYLQDRSEIEA